MEVVGVEHWLAGQIQTERVVFKMMSEHSAVACMLVISPGKQGLCLLILLRTARIALLHLFSIVAVYSIPCTTLDCTTVSVQSLPKLTMSLSATS